jgi:thiamine biosynthesis lipoprotein
MSASGITRRRAITILATSAAGFMYAGPNPAQSAVDQEWRGFAMGTDARIVFGGVDKETARRAATAVTAEIERLEGALSLFRQDSEISRLNRDKTLADSSGEMTRALGLALAIARITDGLFDPTVQALWELYADWFAARSDTDFPPRSGIAKALRSVDWKRIEMSGDVIRIGETQRLTLNGLGQGYVTDRIADLLRSRGFDHVLVDLGEQRTIGRRADGEPWRIALPGAADILLAEGALATSEGSGCVFGAGGAIHHLFDPRTGHSASHWRRVTVHHRSAAVADALSTAFYAATADELAIFLRRINGLSVWTTDFNGRMRRWSSY